MAYIFSMTYYRSQRSCGKVMFLHLSVILSTGGACVACTPPATHAPLAMWTPYHTCPPRHAHPLATHAPNPSATHAPLPCTPPPCMPSPPCHARPPPAMHVPPAKYTSPVMHAPGILWDAVNERAVRILLECILVFYTAGGRAEGRGGLTAGGRAEGRRGLVPMISSLDPLLSSFECTGISRTSFGQDLIYGSFTVRRAGTWIGPSPSGIKDSRCLIICDILVIKIFVQGLILKGKSGRGLCAKLAIKSKIILAQY